MNESRDLDHRLVGVKLLRLFEALYNSRSVTRAGELLGQSQPTTSIWLAQLREELADPLFVRTPDGMLPTARAQQLIDPVRDALSALRTIAHADEAFVAEASERQFTLAMTDASHITLLPMILRHLSEHAPGIRLEIARISNDTPRLLMEGDIDIAVGLIPGLEAGFYQQVLFPQDWVCLIGPGLLSDNKALDLDSYQASQHVGIVAGTGAPLLENALKEANVERKVLLKLPGFLGLRNMLLNSPLIATVPRHIGETLAADCELSVHDCPFPVPGFTVKQHWHERYHRDAGNQWMRHDIAGMFQN